MAFKYLSRALVPLLLGYAVYSLVYEEHKGWYSFVVGMLAGSVSDIRRTVPNIRREVGRASAGVHCRSPSARCAHAVR